jgi:tetratricopeptide (TPR) repeat protein
MASTTFQDKSVAKALEQVVPVRLKYNADHREQAKKHEVLWAPTFITLTADGQIADRFLMYQKPERFVRMFQESLQARQRYPILAGGRASSPAELAQVARFEASNRKLDSALARARSLKGKGYAAEDAARTYLAIAEASLYGRKWKEALEMFQNALSVARTVDEEGYALVYAGQMYGLLGNKAKAIACSEAVLKLRGVNPNYVAYARDYLKYLKGSGESRV